jgi:hypothetical protein
MSIVSFGIVLMSSSSWSEIAIVGISPTGSGFGPTVGATASITYGSGLSLGLSSTVQAFDSGAAHSSDSYPTIGFSKS